VIREGGDAEIYPRKIKALARAKFATDSHRAMHLADFDLIDEQLHQSVVQKQAIAGQPERSKWPAPFAAN